LWRLQVQYIFRYRLIYPVNKKMDLRKLRYFVVTAEELHFGRAAQRLGLSQPPLSVQIQALERELGVLLLERDRRNVKLTTAGSTLLHQGRKVLAQLELAADLTRRAARGEHGTLSIGFITPVEYSFLPGVLRKYRRRYPGIALQLREMMSDAQIKELRDGTLDIGIVNAPIRAPNIRYQEISRDPVIIAIPSEHSLARTSGPVPIKRLAGEDTIMFPRNIAPDLFDEIIGWCRESGFSLRITQETQRTQTIISLVSAGLGIAIVPGSMRNLKRKGVRYRDFRGDRPYVRIGVAWSQGNTSPVAENFVKFVAANRVHSI